MRKVFEQKNIAFEEKNDELEKLMETTKTIAEDTDRKYDEVIAGVNACHKFGSHLVVFLYQIVPTISLYILFLSFIFHEFAQQLLCYKYISLVNCLT